MNTISKCWEKWRHNALSVALLMGLAASLGACTSQAAREAEIAEQEAARAAEQEAAEQEATRIAAARERQRALEEQRRLQAEAAEQARLQAQREREEAEARAEAERRAREEAERRERERQAAIAAREQERQEKLQRIDELEQQIADIQTQIDTDDTTTAVLQEAVLVAEELLQVLAEEQGKYDNTDAQGNPVEPLSKDLIAELEARREDLMQQVDSQ